MASGVQMPRADEGAQGQAEGRGEDVLAIENLHVEFQRGELRTHAVRGLNVTLRSGIITGVAGESGSGKSASAMAAMGLLPRGTKVTGSIRYRGQELLGLPERRLQRFRGGDVAMIFQETATALNPVIKVGAQLTMATKAHLQGSRPEIRERVRDSLSAVRLTDHDRVLHSYPHELSGGMCQRVVIAMALSCGSKVLLADEPTTALDVSVQGEILALLRSLVAERGLAVMMISHDLAVLAELCTDIVVMYRGEVVETGPVDVVLRSPVHPYTRALIDCLPRLRDQRASLPEIVRRPVQGSLEKGCRYRDRCPWASDVCLERPQLAPFESTDRWVRCLRAAELDAVAPSFPEEVPHHA